jgi:hypothetical protein
MATYRTFEQHLGPRGRSQADFCPWTAAACGA